MDIIDISLALAIMSIFGSVALFIMNHKQSASLSASGKSKVKDFDFLLVIIFKVTGLCISHFEEGKSKITFIIFPHDRSS